MATLHVELSDAAYETLTERAHARQVPPSQMIESLLNQPFFELSEGQMREVDLAIEELDRGEIATDEEVQAAFASWTVRLPLVEASTTPLVPRS